MDSVVVLPASANHAGDFYSIRAELRGTNGDVHESCKNELTLPHYGTETIVFLAYMNGEAVGYGRAMRYCLAREGNLYQTIERLPEGWYLRGVVVKRAFRERGIAKRLTQKRLEWLSERTSQIYCFLDSDEKQTIPMYEALGFGIVSSGWNFSDPALKGETGILLERSEGTI